jgi:phage protein U
MAKFSILNLNNLPVEMGHAPNSISGSHKWNNPKQDLVTQKPTKQRTGADLDTISFTVRLRKEFLDLNKIQDNPKQYYKKIKALGDDGDVIVITDGDGYVYGKYTLETMDFSVLETADNGGWVDVELTLNFEEFANKNDETTDTWD